MSKAKVDSSNVNLMHCYCLYSTILALKLLALSPLASMVCNPEKLQRANVSDLKNLTPFWLVAALYITTAPDATTALTLFRVFVLARLVAAVGHVQKLPSCMIEGAFFISFLITLYMGAHVVYTYRAAI